jgi:hypothetical protein
MIIQADLFPMSQLSISGNAMLILSALGELEIDATRLEVGMIDHAFGLKIAFPCETCFPICTDKEH